MARKPKAKPKKLTLLTRFRRLTKAYNRLAADLRALRVENEALLVAQRSWTTQAALKDAELRRCYGEIEQMKNLRYAYERMTPVKSPVDDREYDSAASLVDHLNKNNCRFVGRQTAGYTNPRFIAKHGLEMESAEWRRPSAWEAMTGSADG